MGKMVWPLGIAIACPVANYAGADRRGVAVTVGGIARGLSQQRLGAAHIRDYPADCIGSATLGSRPVTDGQLVNRRASRISILGQQTRPPPLARAAALFASTDAPADIALAQLDALLLSPVSFIALYVS